jgi:hypothetical protein
LQNLNKLPEPVKKVLQVKYAAKPFSQLNNQEKDAHSIALLIKINIVTGWPVPDSEEEQNILAEQLKLYLIENWPLYNVDEIMYAIRAHATVLNNWGKNMNLTLIGKAMIEYEKERKDVSALEESKAPLETNLLTMPADWKELCEAYYQDYLANKFVFSIMPFELYDEFVRCKMMAEDAFEDWINEARATLLQNIKIQYLDNITEKEKHELQRKYKDIENGESEMKVEQQAKKLAVEFLYKTAKERSFKHLFKKE